MTVDLLPVQTIHFFGICQDLLNGVKQFEDSGCAGEATSSEFAVELAVRS